MRALKRKKTHTSVSWAFHSDASGHVFRAGVQNQCAHVIILLFCAFAQRKCITDFYERPRPFMFNNLWIAQKLFLKEPLTIKTWIRSSKKKIKKKMRIFYRDSRAAVQNAWCLKLEPVRVIRMRKSHHVGVSFCGSYAQYYLLQLDTWNAIFFWRPPRAVGRVCCGQCLMRPLSPFRWQTLFKCQRCWAKSD